MQSLLLMILRGSALLLRFVLYLYLARLQGPEILGQLGLITAFTILYSSVGDFCLLQNIARDSVLEPYETTLSHLKAYVKFLPFNLIFILAIGTGAGILLDERYVFIATSLLLFFEMINNGFFNFLLNQSKSLAANLLYFIRSGAWVIAYCAVCALWPELQGLETLLSVWLIFSALATVLLIPLLKIPGRYISEGPALRTWFIRSVRQSGNLLKLNFVTAINDSCASFVLSATLGLERFGIFVYFQQVASALLNLLKFGVIQPLWPKLITAYQVEGMKPQALLNNHLKIILLISVALATLAFPAFYVLTLYMDKKEFIENFQLFFPILILFILSSVGCLYDTVFYSLKGDKIQQRLLMQQLPLNVGLMIFLSFQFQLLGAVIASILSAIIALVLRQRQLTRFPSKII